MAKPELAPRELLRLEISRRMDDENPEPDKPIKNAQHKLFAEKFVEHDQGKQAAIAAGYAEKSAYTFATKLMKDPLIRSWIAYWTVEANIDLKLDKNWVKRRLMKEADFFGPGAVQSARVQALNKLGVIVGLWDEGKPEDDEIGVTIGKRNTK